MNGFVVAGAIVALLVCLIAFDLYKLRRRLQARTQGGLLSRRRQDELRRVYDDIHRQAIASRRDRLA